MKMPADDVIDRIARELCAARGEDPEGGFMIVTANASGAPSDGRSITGTMLSEAKRDVRFVLGWYLNMEGQP